MIVYELLDHQINKIVGIYINFDSARWKIYELCGSPYSTRYKIYTKSIKDIIYESDLDCIYQEDPREREFDDHDWSDVNSVPF